MKAQKQLYKSANSDLQSDQPFWSVVKNLGLAKNPCNTTWISRLSSQIPSQYGMTGLDNRPVIFPWLSLPVLWFFVISPNYAIIWRFCN